LKYTTSKHPIETITAVSQGFKNLQVAFKIKIEKISKNKLRKLFV